MVHQLSPSRAAKRQAEDALWAAYMANRSAENRNAIFVIHTGLIWGAVLNYYKSSCNTKKLTPDELFSEASEIAIRCIENFDPSLGFRFTTYFSKGFFKTIHKRVNCRKRTIRTAFFGDHTSWIPDRSEQSGICPFVAEMGCTAASALRFLEPRDRKIMRQRYILGMTMEKVASENGISKARIGQIINKSLEKIREKFGIEGVVNVKWQR